ncbi:unnamed protein product [Mucor circinelloides]
MSQDATFGGNMELVAFAKLKKVDIKVYQPGMIYVINGVDDEPEAEEEEEEESRQTLHIAYHSWEHYSSVRNIDGPYSGPPEIKMIEKILDDVENTNKEDKSGQDPDEELSSKEKVVRSAFPDASIRKIRRLLIKHKGDPDKVIDAMYESEQKDVHNEQVAVDPATTENTDKADTLIQTLEDMAEQKEDTAVINDNSSLTNQDIPDQIPGETLLEENEKEQEASQNQQEETSEAPDKKPKKLSAAERKKEQKKRQKENKLMKDRAKAARKAGYQQQAKLQDDKEQGTSSDVVAASQSMKEMYI